MKLLQNLSAVLAASLVMGSAVTATEPKSQSVSTVYDGKGMCIAILDNGFFLEHESFIMDDLSASITSAEIGDLLASDSLNAVADDASAVYVNAKIPFAYDYGDGDTDVHREQHNVNGTAMISISAGNASGIASDNPAANGIAPGAQVFAMKVYSKEKSAVTDEAMTAAIEDAVILGADVILITLAEPCGPEFDPYSEELISAIQKAADAGVITVCRAGDVYEYGKRSVFDDEYDSSYMPSDYPDIGTIAWPGSLPSVLTVGASESNAVETEFFSLPNGKKIPYGDSCYLYESLTNGMTFGSFFDGQTFEYVMVDGVGTAENFAVEGDLTGKFAVVKRGEISFMEKANNAAACGAVGLIVIDNTPDKFGALSTKMDLSEAAIPAVIVSAENGTSLKNAPDKRLSLGASEKFVTETHSTSSPASYSANGTTPNLGLKPDITAIGTNVECASDDGGYIHMSSTAASAAKVAGMCAVLKQKVLDKNNSLSPYETAELVKAKLVSSAELMTLFPSGKGISPRIQGGGDADLDAALNAELLLTAGGRFKAELGDGYTRLIQFSVTAKNLSDKAKLCTLDGIVGSDGYNSYTYAELDIENPTDPLYAKLGASPTDILSLTNGFSEFSNARMMIGSMLYQLNSASDSYSPYTFTLLPGESQTFDITVEIDEPTYKEYKRIFKNGFFIEGFVRITCEEETASVPFVGFSGSFGSAPYLDASVYDGTVPIYDSIHLYRDISDSAVSTGGKITLGFNPEKFPDEPEAYDKTAIAFSPVVDRNNAVVMLNLALLRSVKDLTVTVTDPSGNVVSEKYFPAVGRTYVSSSSRLVTSAAIPVWNGRAADNVSYIYPDGLYKITVTAKKPVSNAELKFSYNIVLDTEAPTVTSYTFSNSDDRKLLTLQTSDNHRIMRTWVLDSGLTHADMTEQNVYDISDFYGEYIYIDIYDYAANSTVVRINNPNYVPDES